MKAAGYYRDIQTKIECNEKNHEKPLIVNCTGCYKANKPFLTYHPRGRQDYYIQIIASGELTAETADGKCRFSAGEFIIWEAEKAYRYELAQDKSVDYLFLHFTGFNAGRSISDLGLLTNRIYRFSDSDKAFSEITDVFERLFAEFSERRPFFDEAAAYLLSELLVKLARSTEANSAESRRLSTIAYLHQNFGRDTDIGTLAAMEHLSTGRYRELFRAQTGFSPSEYRTSVRLSHACRMLSETDLTVLEIAADCGYPDVFYFMRIFKQKLGLTPSEYRVSARKNEG